MEIEEIVEKTIQKLIREQYMHNTEDMMYKYISQRLYQYYDGKKDDLIKIALKKIKQDKYFRILPMYYKDKRKIERIAEEMGVDVSTIVRNKKRICIEIYVDINSL